MPRSGPYRKGLLTPQLLEFLQGAVDAPEVWFAPDERLAQQARSVAQLLFAYAKATEPRRMGELGRLSTENVDTEQIWQQLVLRNRPAMTFLTRRAGHLARNPDVVTLMHQQAEGTGAGRQRRGAGKAGSGRAAAVQMEVPAESESEAASEAVSAGDDDDDDDSVVFNGAAVVDSELEDDLDETAPLDHDGGAGDSDSDAGDSDDDEAPTSAGAASQKRKRGDDAGAEDDMFDIDDMERFADMEEEEEDDRPRRRQRTAGADDDEEEEEEEEEEEGEDADAGEEEEEDDDEEMEEDFDIDAQGAGARFEDFFGDRKSAKASAAKRQPAAGTAGDGGGASGKTASIFVGSDEEDEGDEGGEDGADGAPRTEYERRQRQLRSKVAELEDELVADKPWHLKGEVSARDRPENSLLEQHLQFERAAKPAPVVTAEVTEQLEDVIKRRILDELWDDPQPKVAATTLPERRVRADVSQEKSKAGLAAEYEQDYLRQATGLDMLQDEKKKKQTELLGLFKKVCHKLDALTNFHFTPKPFIRELEVAPAVAAIAMEEVLPMTVSEASARAPEEVYDKKRGREGVVRGEAEATQEERQRLRRAKKVAKRKEKRQKEREERVLAKVNPGLGNKHAKEKLLESIRGSKNVVTGTRSAAGATSYTKSASFFAKLQTEAQQAVGAGARAAGKGGERTASAAALKL